MKGTKFDVVVTTIAVTETVLKQRLPPGLSIQLIVLYFKWLITNVGKGIFAAKSPV